MPWSAGPQPGLPVQATTSPPDSLLLLEGSSSAAGGAKRPDDEEALGGMFLHVGLANGVLLRTEVSQECRTAGCQSLGCATALGRWRMGMRRVRGRVVAAFGW